MQKKRNSFLCKLRLLMLLHGNIHFSFFPLILLPIYLISCGIEEYIYLNPVNLITNIESDIKTQFFLPEFQPSSVFTGYKIFYRIYLSDFNATRNASIESDWNRIYQARETPTLILNILDSLSYKEVHFYEEDSEKTAYPLIANSNGLKFVIDFNIEEKPKYVKLIEYNSSNTIEKYYQLCRLPTFKGKLPFQYPDDLTQPDISTPIPTNSNQAFVQLVIAATGFNSGSIILSEATRLGVFLLPTN